MLITRLMFWLQVSIEEIIISSQKLSHWELTSNFNFKNNII